MTRAIRALVDGLSVETISIDADATQLAAGQSDGVLKVFVAPQPMLAGLKHLNRLEQVLARAELDDAEECFLSNAIIGVWPIARVLDRDRARLRPGRIAQSIIDALEARFGFPRSQ